MASERDREMALEWIRTNDGCHEPRLLADLLALRYAEGVKAALAEVRDIATSYACRAWEEDIVKRVVDEAERAMSVTPREAEEGKGT